MKNIRLQGFTLVEMSIVLVIIATLLGGVMLGQSLINASRLQTVITDADSYSTAVVNFKQTYQSLPGDFSNATAIWGTDNVGCPAGGGTSGTCNGDGNGQITNPNSAGQVGESFLFWQHLNKAGMFLQSLGNQSSTGGVNDSTIGVNVPASSIRGSGFSVIWLGTLTGDADHFLGTYGNIISFGKSHGQISGAVDYNITRDPVITPDQAAQIDAKIDDGLPAYGKVVSYKKNSTIAPQCTTSDSEAASTYNVSNKAPICSLIFVMGF